MGFSDFIPEKGLGGLVEVSDLTAAREVVATFLGYIKDYDRYDEMIGHLSLHNLEQYKANKKTWGPSRDVAEEGILGLQTLIEEIGRHLDPGGDADRFRKEGDSWSTAHSAAVRLLGAIDQKATRDKIFGPQGPSLAAKGLHPWVWNAVIDLWDGGHYREAVLRAAATIEKQTQLKLDRADLTGADLYSQAFSLDPGRRLRFSGIRELTEDGKRSREWISAHQGALYFGRGCTQGIRNLGAHGTKSLNEQEALEYLAALSILARWVNAAEVLTPEKQD